MDILVIGGTGVISRELVRQLADRGDRVTAVTRGERPVDLLPAGVEHIAADRNSREAFAGKLAGRRFDAVIDMVAFTREDAEQTVDLFSKQCGQIVIVSSVAAYRRPLSCVPTFEESIEFWETDEYIYGYRKAIMERYLFERMEAGLPITIVRPSLTFGDGARNVGVLRQNAGILDRIRRGRPLVLFGDGTHAWSFTFTPDLARMMIALLGTPGALGEAFQLASQDLHSWREFYLTFGRIVGREPELFYVPSRLLYECDPDLFGHIYFEKSHPGLFSDRKYRRVTGDERGFTTLETGVRRLVESWERDNLQPDPNRDALEERIVELSSPAWEALRSEFGG